MAKEKKKKMTTAQDILEEYVYGERTELEDLVGKKVKILKAETSKGEFGEFYIATLDDDSTFATASDAIVKVLKAAIDNDLFPIVGTIKSTPSKKRKGKSYYSIT